MYARAGKRLLDVLLSSLAITALAPVFLLVACLIVLDDGRPVLFRQRRLGRHQRPFEILKFRTMHTGTREAASRAAHDDAVTRVGRTLRRSNIDELPQLLNILRGEMSLVGPRPALPSQADLIGRRAAGGAYSVRPGLTGLAQVRSFDNMPEETKAAYDNEYAASVSLRHDIRILRSTVSYLRRPPPKY